MQFKIENENNDLQSLLIKIQDQSARAQDIIADTNQLQFQTVESSVSDNKQSKIIIEGSKGEPTKQITVNDVCFDQIASKAEIDVRTARRLKNTYSKEFDSLINAIWQNENSKRMIRMFDLTDSQV